MAETVTGMEILAPNPYSSSKYWPEKTRYLAMLSPVIFAVATAPNSDKLRKLCFTRLIIAIPATFFMIEGKSIIRITNPVANPSERANVLLYDMVVIGIRWKESNISMPIIPNIRVVIC